MKKISLVLLLILFILSSCATTERTYSFVAQDGIRVFLRPVKLNGDIPAVVDMTIPTEKSRVSGDSTINYSILTEKGFVKDIDSVYLSFMTEDGSFITEENELMYIEGAGDDYIEIRFTSIISEASTLTLLDSNGVLITLMVDGVSYSLDSKSFIASLNDAKGYVL